MRRTFTIIFFLILSTSCLLAINTRGHYFDSFNISAYKIGVTENESDYFKLYVVDSIYDSFVEPTGSEAQIDISNKVNNYLDDLRNNPQPRTTTFNADTMVFHVIAMGNRTGNYTLSISFGRLENENGDVIRTAYTMGNARINFENSASKITWNGYTYYVSAPIKKTEPGRQQNSDSWFSSLMNTNPVEPSQKFTNVISNAAGSVGLEWAIAVPNKEFFHEDYDSFLGIHYDYTYTLENEISPLWIARSAVAMSIDQKDYESCPNGEYKAAVTVTFQQN